MVNRGLGAGARLLSAVLLLLAVPAAAAGPERVWSARTASAEVGAALERKGGRESLMLRVQPHDGVRIEPPVLRVDAPALMRPRIAVQFPTAVRGEGKGRTAAVSAALPLAAPGTVRFGDADRNDGALRVEYRYCTATASACGVESVDIPLRAGPQRAGP